MSEIQVLDIGVEWYANYANDPSLCFLLDRKPEWDRYDKRPCVEERVSGEQAAIIGSRKERRGVQTRGVSRWRSRARHRDRLIRAAEL